MERLKELALVEFPGVLKDQNDPRKAIAALGGEDAVRMNAAMPFAETAPPLALNLRPGVNSSNSNIVAERAKPLQNVFLLKVTQDVTELTSESTEEGSTEGHPSENKPCAEKDTIQASIEGRVTSITSFKGISDFQYHSPAKLRHLNGNVERSQGSKSAFDVPERDLNQLELAGEALFHVLKKPDVNETEHVDTYIDTYIDRLRPLRFARSTKESGTTDYWFKQYGAGYDRNDSSANPARARGALGEDRRSDANRLSALYHRISMDTDKVPSCPDANLTPPVLRGRDAFDSLYELVTKLFEERPIWIRRALFQFIPNHLKKSFKRVIYMTAYCFHGPGPFFQAWIRYGYDPRKDPTARQYQVLEVRCNHPVVLAAAKIQDERREQELGESENEAVAPARNILSRLPFQKNNFIQICDITLEEVAKFCEEEECLETFDKRYGFFSKEAYQKLMFTIKGTLVRKSAEIVGKERTAELLQDYRESNDFLLKRKQRRVRLTQLLQASVDSGSPTGQEEFTKNANADLTSSGSQILFVPKERHHNQPPSSQQHIPHSREDPNMELDCHHESNENHVTGAHEGSGFEEEDADDGDENVEDAEQDNLVTGGAVTAFQSNGGVDLADVEGYRIFGDDAFDDGRDDSDDDFSNEADSDQNEGDDNKRATD